MKKTAFVTGAAGFLGRNLVEALLQDQWTVHALVRSAAPAWMHNQGLAVHHGALDDTASVVAAMSARTDAVFHLAGNTSMWSGDAQALIRDNVTATHCLLEAARQRQARRVVMTSTLGLFQDSDRRINESTALQPAQVKNLYLRSKLQADALLTAAAQQGQSVVSLHPAHILGPYDSKGWVKLFDDAARGALRAAPRGRASFCAASAVAQAHIAAARHPAPARRYVLGGEDASYLDVFAQVAGRVHARPVTSTVPNLVLKTVASLAHIGACFSGKRPSMTPGLAAVLTRTMLADSTQAQRDLGYPHILLNDMLDTAHADWATRKNSTHKGLYRR